MEDLVNKKQIEVLMRAFYTKALQNHTIGYFFTEVIKIDLETHLPHICAFWEQALFHTGTYKKHVLQIHMDLHQKAPLEKKHFDSWLALFNETVDENFEGIYASKIKTRALSIATVMQLKLHKQK